MPWHDVNLLRISTPISMLKYFVGTGPGLGADSEPIRLIARGFGRQVDGGWILQSNRPVPDAGQILGSEDQPLRRTLHRVRTVNDFLPQGSDVERNQ
jgi:hypothetical protein